MFQKRIYKYFAMTDKELLNEQIVMGRRYRKCFDRNGYIIDKRKENELQLENRFIIDAMYARRMIEWDFCKDPECWRVMRLDQRRYQYGACARVSRLIKLYEEYREEK